MAGRNLGTIAIAFAVIAAACGGGDSDDAADDATGVPTTTETTEGTEEPAAPDSTAAPTTAPPAVTTAMEVPIPEVVVSVVGEEELVLDQSEEHCGGQARPDLPARALRSGDQVSLLLSNPVNHRLVGADFDSLVLSCDPVLTSAFDHDPAAHAHHEWMGAAYTEDGVTVHGVVHNEYHGYEGDLADSRRAILDGEDPGDWQYVARAAGGTSPMSPAESGFTAGGLCIVDFWGAHPDNGCDAVSRWTSDRDGQLVIDVDATKAGVGGDGVILDVRIDGAVVWEADLTDEEPSASIRLTEDVALGSTIDVGVAAKGDSSFDATEIRTNITPDGDRCTEPDPFACQWVALTAVRSEDGGATYQRTSEPSDLVVAPPGAYVHDAGFAGTWQPSNIVAHPDGGHVMIVQYDDAREGGGTQYSCLLRTEDLADPTAWRAWDGESFSLPAVDPYTTDEVAPACARVAAAPISGLTWHAELELFFAVGGFGQFGRNGQYAIVSPDLFRWSDPIFIQPAEFVFTTDAPPWEPYATLIDHSSPSPSFDVIGDAPHLYFSRINDPTTLDFDLVRVPLEISLAG